MFEATEDVDSPWTATDLFLAPAPPRPTIRPTGLDEVESSVMVDRIKLWDLETE